MRIEGFDPTIHLEPATELFAISFRSARARHPLLPSSYEEMATCRALLEKGIAEGAVGAVALDDSGMAGYQLAVAGDDGTWGRHVWSNLEHHACRDPEAARRLYAYLAQGWVDDGYGHHYVVVGADELEPWLHLAFGHESIAAIASTAAGQSSEHVRRAGPDDLQAIVPLMPLIGQDHSRAPTFAYIAPDFYEGIDQGHRELLEDPSVGYFVVEADGEIQSYAVFYPVPGAEATLLKPAGMMYLIVAASRPESRNRGLMSLLTRHGLAWCREQGYEACVTDWRAANLNSSKVWPHLGFDPFAYRLHRIIDPRLFTARSIPSS